MGYFTFLSVVCSLSLLTSCSMIHNGEIYDANSLNIPLHKVKKEVKGSAGYGGILGFNADISFTASDKFVLKAGGNYNHQNLVRTSFMGNDYNLNLKNHYVEGAAGYYKFMENNFVNSVELSAGYGNGLTKKTNEYLGHGSGEDGVEGSYHKYFLQFNAGHVTEKLELGIGARYSGIFYPNLSWKFFSVGSELTDINIHLPSLEIAVLHALGGKNLKATLQYGLAIPLKESKFSSNKNGGTFTGSVNNWSAIFQLGFRYRFLLAKPERI